MNRKTLIGLAASFALTAGHVALAAAAATATTAAIFEAMSPASTTSGPAVETAATHYSIPLKMCSTTMCG